MRALVIFAALVAFTSEHYVLAQPFKELLKLVEQFNATEPIELEFCKDLGYSKTPKFNFMGISQKEALTVPSIKGLMMLQQIGCTSIAKLYICALVTPKPQDTFGAAPPCKSICSSIENSCSRMLNMLMSIPQGSCKSDVIGADYRGKISQTRSGVQCQKWSSQRPHSHRFLPQEYAQEDLSENYCRNPDRESDGPWCYTADRDRRWEYCDVPLCQLKFGLMCDRLPNDGCMEMKANDDSGELELKLKGEPKLADLLKFSSETLPLLRKEIGNP